MTLGPRGLALPSAVSLYRSKFIRLSSRMLLDLNAHGSIVVQSGAVMVYAGGLARSCQPPVARNAGNYFKRAGYAPI
jgi:hypothetical protein